MSKNINEKPFDEATKTKLSIFGECFKEWLPVFNNDLFTDEIHIFDFFAGSGKDVQGSLGSPLILLKQAKGLEQAYCRKAKKPIYFYFNDSIKKKYIELNKNIKEYIDNCMDDNDCESCVYDYSTTNNEFKDIFNKSRVQSIFNNKKHAKFVLLDQYGFKEIDDTIFKNLTLYPKTDFIFFISSSNIKRFKEHENVKKYINTEKINFDESKPKDCHTIMADYFRNLAGNDFFIHHFTIQKGSNYWGLIFGTGHSLGMEKFLKICWEEDIYSGESNCNLHGDYEKDSMFGDIGENVKKDAVAEEVTSLILSRKIVNNKSGFNYVMKKGCLPKLFTEVVKRLEKEKKISRSGDLNYSSTNIHKVKTYNIKVL